MKVPPKRFPSVAVLLREMEQNLAGPEATQALGDVPR